jgi:HAD superfamily hydrolase (TIGR01509 family)
VKPGLLFDLDGVLVDTGEYHWQAWKWLATEEPRFKMSHDDFLRSFGQRNEEILGRLLPSYSVEEHQALADRKEALFRKEIAGKIELLPGVERFLQQVVDKGLPRTIASSTPPENLHFMLAETRLGFYFDQYVSGAEVTLGKPAPDVFLEGARRLGLPAGDCIVFEDAPVGLQAGKAAGCYLVALATTHPRDELEGYDVIVDSLGNLSLENLLLDYQLTHP